MSERMIHIHNELMDLHHYIEKQMKSKYDKEQIVENILAECKRFRHRNEEYK